ncbi:MAG: Phosphatidylglycerophosphatase B [Anaerolineales bacterium]|nr:Phosphatidylglycerophosphatase B [Anaerolineales bacterium]
MPNTWIRWGIEVIQLAQSHNSDTVDAVFRLFTFLGYEEFYLLLIPVIFWCLDKRVGVRLATILLLSGYLNFVFKNMLGWPRPPADQVRQVTHEESFGMPSGHAQNAVVVFGYLSSVGAYGWGIAALIAVMIGVSRVFLGTHFPQDVIGGWIMGLVILGFALTFLEKWNANRLSPNAVWAVTLGGPIALAIAHTTSNTVQTMGALWGLGAGYLLQQRLVRFNPHTTWRRQIAKIAVGVAVLFGLSIGLKALLPDGNAFRFLRYGIIGVWATFLTPWLFVRLGWG